MKFGIQQAARGKSGSRKQVRSPAGKRPANPIADRYGETCFRSLDQGRRHIAMQDITQYSFPAAALDEGRSWQAPGKLDNTMIEQRYTDLERHGHTCTIDFGEDVVRQVLHHVVKANLRRRLWECRLCIAACHGCNGSMASGTTACGPAIVQRRGGTQNSDPAAATEPPICGSCRPHARVAGDAERGSAWCPTPPARLIAMRSSPSSKKTPARFGNTTQESRTSGDEHSLRSIRHRHLPRERRSHRDARAAIQ